MLPITYTNTQQLLLAIIEQSYPEGRSRFRPSRVRLDEIIAEGNELVANASKSDLEQFSE